MDAQRSTINDVENNQPPSRLLTDDPVAIENGQVSRPVSSPKKKWAPVVVYGSISVVMMILLISEFNRIRNLNRLEKFSIQSQCQVDDVDSIPGKCGDDGLCTFSYVKVSVNWTVETGSLHDEKYYKGVATDPIACGYSASSPCPVVNGSIPCRVVENSSYGPNPSIHFDKFKSQTNRNIPLLVYMFLILIVSSFMCSAYTYVACYG
jgi:hypothetical protein